MDDFSARRRGTGKSKEDLVADLLRKTVENGATPGEEVSSVQLAHLLVRQHHLDMDAFKLALGRIGTPPRYEITPDGFLVPAMLRANPGRGSADTSADPVDGCRLSPTGRHRMVPYMRGTFATGALHCVHCGVRIEA